MYRDGEKMVAFSWTDHFGTQRFVVAEKPVYSPNGRYLWVDVLHDSAPMPVEDGFEADECGVYSCGYPVASISRLRIF
jgi:hypothetical protein